MLEHSSLSQLHRIQECQDLMADACLCDERHNLVFLSLWGRDTSVQEFLARLTLRQNENGLDHFHLIDDSAQAETLVFVGDVDRLEKRTTRAFRQTLFGSMINVWLFDFRCIKPDKANSCAVALLPKDSDRTQRLWTLVQETCPLPLLDHWRETVLDLLNSNAMLSSLPAILGPIEGYRLALDVPALTTALGELIRNEVLGIEPTPTASDAPLRRAA
jgi:hypothetical protein